MAVAVAGLFATAPGSRLAAQTAPMAHPDLQARLAGFATGARTIAGQRIASHTFLPKLYAELGGSLIWSDPERIKTLDGLVARSWEDGLIPSDFHAAYVKSVAAGQAYGDSRADRDLILTDASVRLLYQLYFGKVSPDSLDPNWNFGRPVLSGDPVVPVADALRSGRLAELVDRARLDHPLYTELKAYLQQYTNYQVSGGWPQLPAGAAVKPGQSDARIPLLRQRLDITGEYEGGAGSPPDLMDDRITAALKTFQSSHGLEPDGVLGPTTIAELNVTPAARIEQIRVNMERARWLLRSLGPEMVIVNVAGFYLHVFLKGEHVWTTRVIVGQSYTKTPIFTELMKTVVLNPDWTVPRSIVRNEMFPKMSADPGYLARNNYYLTDGSGAPVGSVNAAQWTAATFPYGVVQKPGPKNALGQVKFLFPNKYSVYLHDTPGRTLFDKSGRTFSHGCIRVENPLKLAEIILGDRLGWSRAKLDAALATGKQQGIALPKPLPVLILYWTVDPSPEGGISFHQDVYGRDASLLKALNAPFQP